MLVSAAPCAIASTFTSARPSVANRRPARPGWWRIPSPTAEITAHPGMAEMERRSPRSSSAANAAWSAATAVSACAPSTTKQTLCSAEAWLVIWTLTPAPESASNSRAPTPRTAWMPPPSTITIATSRTDEMAFTRRSSASVSFEMTVPGSPGSSVLLMRIGIPARSAGSMVRGWSTCAPK